MQLILALFKHKYVKLIIVCNIYVPLSMSMILNMFKAYKIECVPFYLKLEEEIVHIISAPQTGRNYSKDKNIFSLC